MSPTQAVKPETPAPRLGVFLCECGTRIAPGVDHAVLTQLLDEPPGVGHVETLPFSCLRPGLARIKAVVAAKGLNRLIIAGCESRLLHKKFEQALEGLGLAETQIDMVNLRDHVARVHSAAPAELAQKGAKLIRASQAWLETLKPAPRIRIDYQGPVMVLGGGVAAYGAAQELAAQGVDTLLPLTYDPAEEMQRARQLYLGDYHSYDRLERLIRRSGGQPPGQPDPGGAFAAGLRQVRRLHRDLRLSRWPGPRGFQSRGHHRGPGLGARPSTPGTRP